MAKRQFICTLVEDVILTLQPPQNGFYQSLNFIPGRCFRSIVANDSEKGLCLTRNPNIRFGDAHIAHIRKMGENKTYWRTMHIPISMMYPKHWSVGHACYLYHFYDRSKDKSVDGLRPQQMKQCRHGYYAFYGGTAYPAFIMHNSSNKCCEKKDKYDKKHVSVHSFDSLRRGSQFLFEVETQSDDDAKEIASILTKRYHCIGRSKGAQYGTVLIEEQPFNQIHSCQQQVFNNKGEKIIIVYADSRLVFFDDCGQCTFRPTAEQMGVEGGEIDWELTQVRTFCYMPWNSNRQTQEADISGFEKGSTFVIKPKAEYPKSNDSYVGNYTQDGFGHVIYNPDFLLARQETNGKACYQISEARPVKSKPNKTKCQSGLITFINKAQEYDEEDNYIYRKVNDFINKNIKEFKPAQKTDQTIASHHWLSLRSVIMGQNNPIDLEKNLFGKKKNGKYSGGFLTQISMKNKWNEKRVAMLLEFFNMFNYKGKRPLMIKAFYILISELYTQTLVDSLRKKK